MCTSRHARMNAKRVLRESVRACASARRGRQTGLVADAVNATVAAVLAERAAALRAEIGSLTVAPDDVGTIQFGKRAGDATNVAAEQLSRVSAHEQLTSVLEQIEQAQAKLEGGTYGRCDGCGKAISPARLEALPWACECVDCRAALDAQRRRR